MTWGCVYYYGLRRMKFSYRINNEENYIKTFIIDNVRTICYNKTTHFSRRKSKKVYHF